MGPVSIADTKEAGLLVRGLGLRLRGVGELNSPVLGLTARIDFKKAGTVITAYQTIVTANNPEFTIAGAHEGLALPLPAALIHAIDVVELRRQRAAQQCLAGARLQVPPAFRDPLLAIGIGQGNAHPLGGIVAQAEIGRRWSNSQPAQHGSCQKQAQGFLAEWMSFYLHVGQVFNPVASPAPAGVAGQGLSRITLLCQQILASQLQTMTVSSLCARTNRHFYDVTGPRGGRRGTERSNDPTFATTWSNQ